MYNCSKKFNIFLENLKNSKNLSLIETIQNGFNLIEALSTDDANPKKFGQSVYFTGAPVSEITIKPNLDNQYFNKTLPDNMLKIVNDAQSGSKIWFYPQAGTYTLNLDPLKSGQGYQNANFTGDAGWAGDSGGYNLGGP
jgi:hypothetical protein